MWGSCEHLCVSAASSHSVCTVRGRRRAFSLFQSLDMWGLFFTVPFTRPEWLIHTRTQSDSCRQQLRPLSWSHCGQKPWVKHHHCWILVHETHALWPCKWPIVKLFTVFETEADKRDKIEEKTKTGLTSLLSSRGEKQPNFLLLMV